MLDHIYRVAFSIIREKVKRRSPQWVHVEKNWRLEHPLCTACNGSVRIQVHHIQPFHLDPWLELVPSNLISLCMGPYECHLRIGHGDSFRCYNPTVQEDATQVLKNPNMRAAIEEKCKTNRRST